MRQKKELEETQIKKKIHAKNEEHKKKKKKSLWRIWEMEM